MPYDAYPTTRNTRTGLRLGMAAAVTGSDPNSKPSPTSPVLVRHMDHLLLDKAQLWPALQPDVVLQLGGRLTSKRLAQFLEWSALGDGRWAQSISSGCNARGHASGLAAGAWVLLRSHWVVRFTGYVIRSGVGRSPKFQFYDLN